MIPSVKQFLLYLLEEAANKPKRLVVVYGGRFQPFHKGHFSAYNWLVDKFGAGNVWIATSNVTNFDSKNGKVSPFTFEEKKQIITTLYPEIKPNRIIKCKNPTFKPVEIFDKYDRYQPVYIAAVGRKDAARYTGNYFHRLPTDLKLPDQMNDLLSINDKAGYYIDIPMKSESISATLVRQDLLAAADDDAARKKLFKQYFGIYDESIDLLISSRLKEIK